MARPINYSSMDNIQRMTIKRCLRVAKQDAKQLSSKPELYVEANALTYFVAINTWLLQAADFDERISLDLEAAIESRGLIATIASSCKCADSVIRDTNPEVPQFLAHAYQTLSKQDMLQLMRYLKRFSPAEADVLKQTALDGFIKTNKRMNSIDKYDNYHYTMNGPDSPVFSFCTPEASMNPKILADVRSIVHDILREYHLDSHDERFSGGACSDASRALYGKLKACCKIDNSFPAGFYSLDPNVEEVNVSMCADIIPVNKSYKTSRIIGKEAAYRQYKMQAVRSAAERSIKRTGYSDRISIEDQSVNRIRCFEGSIHCDLATIDLSSASDSISLRLAHAVLPKCVLNDLDGIRSTILKVGDRRIPSHIFLTAGQAPTFVLECIIFYSIAQVACDYYTALTGDEVELPSVYGDDLIVDTKVFSFLSDILTSLGFIVNEDKSFGDGGYRESCGAEYEFGQDLSTRYYPRKTILNDDVSIASLIELQHRLYHSWRCRYFLDRMVNTMIPGMTSHLPGTQCADLWSDTPTFRRAYARTEGKITSHEYHYRERHYVLLQKDSGKVPQDAMDFLDGWYYYKYLTEGPSYDDPLLELLGVSTSRKQYAPDFGATEPVWALVIE